MIRRWLAVAPATLVLAFGASACGGDDDGGEAQVSKGDYIAEADRLCAEGDEATRPLEERLGQQLQAGEFDAAARTAEEAAAESQRRFEEVRNLDRPEEDSETLDQVLANAQEGFENLDSLIAAIRSGNPAEIQEAARRGQAVNAETDRLAREYGFQECGRQD